MSTLHVLSQSDGEAVYIPCPVGFGSVVALGPLGLFLLPSVIHRLDSAGLTLPSNRLKIGLMPLFLSRKHEWKKSNEWKREAKAVTLGLRWSGMQSRVSQERLGMDMMIFLLHLLDREFPQLWNVIRSPTTKVPQRNITSIFLTSKPCSFQITFTTQNEANCIMYEWSNLWDSQHGLQ